MKKTGIASIIGAGVLVSSLTLSTTAHAQVNRHEAVKAQLKNEVQSKLIHHSFKMNHFNKPSGLNVFHSPNVQKGYKAFSKKSSSSDDDYAFESESNDDFSMANTLPRDKTVIGQFLPYDDVDFYKIKVSKGTLVLGGATNSDAIDLMYAVTEKDFKDSGNLELVGWEYDEGALYEAWEVKKAGTYYVAAFDNDMLDNNTEDDLYALFASYVDTAAPSKPIVNKVDNNDKVVTGKAEAYSTVTVKAGKKTLGNAKASSKGTFSVKISTQKAGTKLSVTAKDKAGNVSSATTVIVKDVIAPVKPTIYRIDDNDKVVKGKAEANASITVRAKGKTIGTGKVNSKGYYSVKIKTQKAGTNVYVYAKDKAGNKSKAAIRKVVKH
ncbi:Ig-like domain-containing protein [Fictibacillus sp. Mic-4]|uniref:Ig-like domain-containing protein n=1 Tax=Fictibacillus sp. Mic-4 TaxID=3132826 RepID=UPI003CE67ED6